MFGGGYNGAVNPNVGSAVFVMDLEDEGRLLKVIDIEDTAKQSYGWTGRLFKRVGGVLVDGNTKLQVKGSGQLPQMCFDSSKGESFTAEFTPSVGFTLHFYIGSGSKDCLDYVKFDEAWPNTRWGGPPKPDYGNFFFRRMSNDIVNSLPADLSVITADGTDKANYDGAIVYATDLEGKLTKINLMEKFTIDTDPNSPTYKGY